MAAPKVMHGARAIVSVVDTSAGGGKVTPVGIWSNFSYQVSYDVQPSYILGRFTPAALTTTSVSPVSIQAGGWRVIDNGPLKEGKFTKIQELLRQEYLQLTVIDRHTNKAVCTIRGCLPTASTSSLSARQLQEATNTYVGLIMEEDQTIQGESPSAVRLPDSKDGA